MLAPKRAVLYFISDEYFYFFPGYITKVTKLNRFMHRKIFHRMKPRTSYVQWTILPQIFVEGNHHPKPSKIPWNSYIMLDSEDIQYKFSLKEFSVLVNLKIFGWGERNGVPFFWFFFFVEWVFGGASLNFSLVLLDWMFFFNRGFVYFLQCG